MKEEEVLCQQWTLERLVLVEAVPDRRAALLVARHGVKEMHRSQYQTTEKTVIPILIESLHYPLKSRRTLRSPKYKKPTEPRLRRNSVQAARMLALQGCMFLEIGSLMDLI